jgi:hypothetical protein
MFIESGKQPAEQFVRFEKRPRIQRVIEEIQSIQPEVVFDVYYGSHHTFDQGKRLSNRITKSDLVIPEYGGWSPKLSQDFNAISQGQIIDVHHLPLFYRGLLSALHKTNKPVKFIDYPTGSKKFEELYEAAKWLSHLENIPYIGEGYVQKFAKVNDQKEEDVIAEIPGALLEFINENPELIKGKEEKNEPLKVLLFLGAAHTRIFHALKEASPKSTRTFDEKPLQFTPFETQVREVLFGRTKKIM